MSILLSGKFEADGGAQTKRAFYGHAAFVRFDDAVADSQAKAGATRIAIASGIDAVEPLAEMGYVLFRYSLTRVNKVYLDLPGVSSRLKSHMSFGRGVSAGIGDKVTDNARHIRRSAFHIKVWIFNFDCYCRTRHGVDIAWRRRLAALIEGHGKYVTNQDPAPILIG